MPDQPNSSNRKDDFGPIGSPRSMSDDDDSESWEGLGSFPSNSNHDDNIIGGSGNSDHIFADEPIFVSNNEHRNNSGRNNNYSLEIVQEGSREETLASGGSSVPPTELLSISASSSEQTPATSNTAEAALNKRKLLAQPLGGGSNSGQHHPPSLYPYNIYQSLDKSKDESDSRHVDNGSDRNGVQRGSTSATNPPATIAKGSWGSSVNSSINSSVDINRKNRYYDRVEPTSTATSSLAPHLTPMSMEEESSSVYTAEAAVTAAAATNTSFLSAAGGGQSVMSARSYQRHHHRRHRHHHSSNGSKRSYMVRHTLATSQQVNANPSTMLRNLFIGIEQERHMHKLTSQNLRAVHNWCLFLPSVLLALFSGLLVLIIEAELPIISNETRVYGSIIVGITALMSVFMQALTRQLNFNTRATLHDITSNTLKRLSEDILLTLSATDHVIPSEYVALIGEKFGQALDVSCASTTIPYKLETAFALLSDRMVLILNPPPTTTNHSVSIGVGDAGVQSHRCSSNGVSRKQHQLQSNGSTSIYHIQRLDYMHLYMTAYDELASEIIHYWAWPFVYPQPRTVSDAALRNFVSIITEGREASLRDGSGVLGCIIRYCCPCLLRLWSACCACCCGNPSKQMERSLFDIFPPRPPTQPRDKQAGYSSSATNAANPTNNGNSKNDNDNSNAHYQNHHDGASVSAYSSSAGGGTANTKSNAYSIRNFMLGQEV